MAGPIAQTVPGVGTREEWLGDEQVRVLLNGALALFAVVLARTAWLSDDSYINFRTIDNFLHGYGLRWNVAERVQTFTDPLWVLLLTAASALTGEFYYTVIIFSIALSLAAAIVYSRATVPAGSAALGGIVLLLCSKAFVDFSTSGLEDPLEHLLLVLFFTVYWRTRVNPSRKSGLLAWLAAACVLTRMDAALLVMPALLVATLRRGVGRAAASLVIGFSPVLAWELFALVYYGFPFPNTAYAKLGAAVPQADLVKQGFVYLLDSIKMDPLTLVVIAAGISAPLLARRRRDWPVALGVLLSVCFVVLVGGDFMTGRFLASPFLCGVLLLTRTDWPSTRTLMPVPILLAVVAAFSSHESSLVSDGRFRHDFTDHDNLVDERRAYYPFTGLMSIERDTGKLTHPWAQLARDLRARGERVAVFGSDGFFGFSVGPRLHSVDPLGLGDPLLARLPARPDWKPGHFERRIPEGYLETLASGRNQIAETGVAAYYTHVQLITRGPIWDLRRFRDIWRLNTGAYDYEIAESSYGLRQLTLADVAHRRMAGAPYERADLIPIHEGGVAVDLGSIARHRIEISLDQNDDYRIVYDRRGRTVGEEILHAPWPFPTDELTLAVHQLAPPSSIGGFDRIRIYAFRGDGVFAMGHLFLKP